MPVGDWSIMHAAMMRDPEYAAAWAERQRINAIQRKWGYYPMKWSKHRKVSKKARYLRKGMR